MIINVKVSDKNEQTMVDKYWKINMVRLIRYDHQERQIFQNMSVSEIITTWLCANLQDLHCYRIGDTAVLH